MFSQGFVQTTTLNWTPSCAGNQILEQRARIWCEQNSFLINIYVELFNVSKNDTDVPLAFML